MGEAGKKEEDEITRALERRASELRDAMRRSEENTERMVASLCTIENRAAAALDAMRPIEEKVKETQKVHENIEEAIKVSDEMLDQVDIAQQAEAMLLWGPRGNLDGYLEAVDILKGVVGFFSSKENFKGVKIFLHQANILLSKAFLIIEGEFKQLLRTHRPPKLQLASKGDSEVGGGNRTQSEHPSKSLETAIYRTPTLIPPEILQLLHRIAQQLVQAGNQQSCYNIYREQEGQ